MRWDIILPLVASGLGILILYFRDWGGDSQCSSLSATERKAQR